MPHNGSVEKANIAKVNDRSGKNLNIVRFLVMMLERCCFRLLPAVWRTPGRDDGTRDVAHVRPAARHPQAAAAEIRVGSQQETGIYQTSGQEGTTSVQIFDHLCVIFSVPYQNRNREDLWRKITNKHNLTYPLTCSVLFGYRFSHGIIVFGWSAALWRTCLHHGCKMCA